MKRSLLRISIAVFILSVFLLIRHYTNAREKSLHQEILNTDSLIQFGKETIGKYDTVYTQSRGATINSTKFITYFYTVNGKTYENEKMIGDVPKSQRFVLFYLPTNPNVHSENPKADLIRLKEQKSNKSTSTLPWLLFLGSSLVFYKVRNSISKEILILKEREELLRSNSN